MLDVWEHLALVARDPRDHRPRALFQLFALARTNRFFLLRVFGQCLRQLVGIDHELDLPVRRFARLECEFRDHFVVGQVFLRVARRQVNSEFHFDFLLLQPHAIGFDDHFVRFVRWHAIRCLQVRDANRDVFAWLADRHGEDRNLLAARAFFQFRICRR